MTSGGVLLTVTIVIPRKIRRSDNASLADFTFISQLPVADPVIELRGEDWRGFVLLALPAFRPTEKFLFFTQNKGGWASLDQPLNFL